MTLQLNEGLQDILQQLRDYGLEPFSKRYPAFEFGKIIRCQAKGDRLGEKTGWYALYEYRTDAGKTLYFGSFGDFRRDVSEKFKVKRGVRLTAEEREVMRARQEESRRAAERRAQYAARNAAKRAEGYWKHANVRGQSVYLDRKRVGGFGVRYGKNGNLLIPIQTVQGLRGLQIILPERSEETGRDKLYWPAGLNKEGGYHIIGPHPEPGETIVIVEGYATGASIHMATNLTVVVAFDAGNLLPVGREVAMRFPGRPLVFAADDDWKTTRQDGTPWNPGVQSAENAAVILGGRHVVPVFGAERADGWTDFNDLHCAEGLDAVRRQVMAVVRPPVSGGWHDQLLYSKSGLISHMRNVALILENDERWVGVLGYDEFSGKCMKLRTPPYGGSPGEWTDLDDSLTTDWLAQQYGLLTKSIAVLEAVGVVSSRNRYHPVRQYLQGLTWDGTPRVETWLTVCLGVELNDYSRKVAKRWLLGAVARVMKPGCKMDTVLILEGLQGAGKSTTLSILGGAWFMDTPFTLGDKEAFQMLRGKWLAELGELDAFNKAESTKAKQFFSASTDTFRESYGRRSKDIPRQCVFAGTTNQNEYFKDPTGNRRYWPVMCTSINLDALREMRDQLWAEACACYQAGDGWWVEREERHLFEAEQEKRYAGDAWEAKVAAWLADVHTGETVTTTQLLGDALNLDYGHWGRPEQTRVGQIMSRLGWPRVRLPQSGRSPVRPWGYQRPRDWRGSAWKPEQREAAF